MKNEYGYWTVIEEVKTAKPGRHYLCECICGNYSIIPTSSLNAGRSTKCHECMYKKRKNVEGMVGRKFGKWLVLAYAGWKNRYYTFLCECECGNKNILYGADIRAKKTSRCQHCHNKECCVRHGMHKHKIYKVWTSIKQRCRNPNAPFYARYGGRGISYCNEWEKFEPFYEWAEANGYEEGLTIDRIDNDGNYEPSNCRWVTHKENCQNR